MGVDCSTQSTKVEVRDLHTGALIGEGHAPHTVDLEPRTGGMRSEQDPAEWWRALGHAARATGVEHVDAIGVAAQQHGLVLTDDSGTPVRWAKLWNDTESAAEAEALLRIRSRADWAAACGSVPVPAFTITKLAWVAAHEPHLFGRARHLLCPHDWIDHRLTGRFVTDRGDASGTGYWSPAEGRWRPDLLACVDADLTEGDWLDRLPEVAGPTEAVGKLLPEAAAHLGLTGTAPVVGPGTGDNMGAALGLGLRTGDVVVSVGTSGTVYAASVNPTADASGAVAGFADATGAFLPLVCTLNASLVTDAIARLLGLDHDELDALALAEPAGAGGVVLVPYLAGERTPDRPDATGTITGLGPDVSRSQVARAAVEGVVCGLLDGLDALTGAGVRTDGGSLLLIGGGARSASYPQVLADLTGRVVTVPAATDQVARGACVQAAGVLSGVDLAEIAESWDTDEPTHFEPTPGVDTTTLRAAYASARG